jgi:AbrB family looped-hinge helix DNA binding protein
MKFIYTEFMNTIKLQQRGLLTLPKKLRDALSLKEGQILTVEQTNGKIILEPQTSTVDNDLAQALTQGLEDIKRGKFIEFGSTTEFHKKLEHYVD